MITSGSALLVGDVNVDLLIRLPRSQRGVKSLAGSEPQLSGGGTIANTAVGISRLGHNARVVAAVGADSYGRWTVDDLRNEGVDVTGVTELEEAFTVMVLPLIEPDGERTIVVWPPEGGAHTQLRPEHVPDDVLQGVAWFHTSGMCFRNEPVRGTILSLMEQAATRSIPVSVDLNLRLELWGWEHGIREFTWAALEYADVVFASGEEELQPLTGVAGDAEAAHALRERSSVTTVIARAGKNGAFLCTQSGTEHLPSMSPPAPVVDTVGAGDAFNAGFIAAKMDGLSDSEAVCRGHETAAHAVSGFGARYLPYARG